MRLFKWAGAVLVAAAIYAAGLGGSCTAVAVGIGSDTTPQFDKMTLNQAAADIAATMTPEEKIGQMMMAGFMGTAVDGQAEKLLQQQHVGGFVFYDRNMQSKEQVRNLTAALQALAGNKLPLFIAVDEEGGKVARMRDELIPAPSQAEIGATGEPGIAEAWAVTTAQELTSLGINVNFAPVADLGSEKNGRAYSSDPTVVTSFLEGAIRGYEQEHFLYTLKHFPGLGKGLVNTHLASYVVTAPREQLEAEDILPFKLLVKEKAPTDMFIMVTHLNFSALDEKMPASLSKNIITGVLRKELGYDGIVITDDLEMKAVSQYYSYEEMGVKAVEAGADIVLVCHDYDAQLAVYNGLLKAYNDGRLSKERIDESVRRIIETKLQHLM